MIISRGNTETVLACVLLEQTYQKKAHEDKLCIFKYFFHLDQVSSVWNPAVCVLMGQCANYIFELKETRKKKQTKKKTDAERFT